MLVLCFVCLFVCLTPLNWGFQPAQEERKDDQEPEGRDLKDREEGGAKEEGAKPEPKRESLETKADKDLKAAQKAVKRHKNMYCKVVLLDDTIFECSVDVSILEVWFCFLSLPSPFCFS